MRVTLSAHSLRNSLHNLYLIFQAMAPGHDFKWIKQHPDYPREREVMASKKSVRSPDPFAVLNCAFQQAARADSSKLNFRNALKYRNAVMMMVLMTSAIRLKNLAELRVGEHLIFYPDHIRMVFEHSVKNREIIDTVLTKQIESFMRTYFDKHRPFLLRQGDDHGAVWVNLDGHPLKYSTIGQLILKTTDEWGHPMTPHGARYALATTIMHNDPRRIAVASAALAHRGVSSVNRVYDQSGGAGAQACWQKILTDRRKL
jgi:site-specific recombinase XerD